MDRSTRIHTLLAASVVVALAQPAAGQAPPDWRWRTDVLARPVAEPDRITDSTFNFAEMAPGWHITMGPGGILYQPRYYADGQFTLEAQIFHFPNSTNGEYGLIVGGSDLDGPASRYVAFVVRGDGGVAAWEVRGGERRMLTDWKRAEAVIPANGKDVVLNKLRLSASGREVVFRANGLDVLILPLEGLPLGGQFGFRVGQGVNLHASTLTATVKLAPVPQGR